MIWVIMIKARKQRYYAHCHSPWEYVVLDTRLIPWYTHTGGETVYCELEAALRKFTEQLVETD